jgi:hypothetical protein
MAARARRNKALVLKSGGRNMKNPVAAPRRSPVVCLGELMTELTAEGADLTTEMADLPTEMTRFRVDSNRDFCLVGFRFDIVIAR